jgi:anthranilate phosphoribosyltransferase
VRPGRVEREVRDPRELGFARCAPGISPAAMQPTTPRACAQCFAGEDRGAHRDALVLNAALALESWVGRETADGVAGGGERDRSWRRHEAARQGRGVRHALNAAKAGA